ncbi:MAG: recombination regulator RecX [Lachnospiraceae bacterium]|nr:recombination regulator RecX [Lachnospiraceae bacterium]
MERVSEIRKLTGGRYLVSLESGLRFPLYGKELSECALSEDAVIEEEVFAYIMEELLPKRARLRAMHLLEKMDRTEYQLRQKLELSAYPDEIIDDAVRYVKEYHYIDDLRYARNYLQSRASSKSIRQMEQELYTKGISKDVARQALSEAELPDEEAQIRALLEKKHYDPAETDLKIQQKMYAYLIRKGYDRAAITRVLRQVQELDCQ